MKRIPQSILLTLSVVFFNLVQLTSANEKPNVVFILIDDLSHYGVGAYGATQINSTQGFFDPVPLATPQIDRLASEGIRANHAFAYPICEPTRVALMSGMNNSRNFLRAKALHESQITFGDIFKRAGYTTGIAGKWKQSRGSSTTSGINYVELFGWDEVHCFDLIGEGARHIAPNFVINGVLQYYNQNFNGGIDPETGRRYYGPDLVNRFALNFIEENQDGPFFLYYPMLLVHDEHTPTPDTVPQEAYDDFQVVTYPYVTPAPYGAFQGDDRRYYPDMAAYMDKMIGRVTDKLDELNLREDTLIVVMGDNGTKQAFSYTLADGSEFVGGKGECRANGMQVPLILSHLGTINQGNTYDGLVNITDIMPTICEAAGIEVPNGDDIDGISFWPQVIGTSTDPHREQIYTWYNANRPMTDTSKLIEFAQEIGFKRYAPDNNYPQGRFFDLRTDPLELVDHYNNTVDIGLGILHRSGLDLTNLNAEQQAAYDRLGTILNENAYVSVSNLGIDTTFAATKFSTSFDGSDGFVSGALNKNGNFIETVIGGMYLPSGQAPNFGTLKKGPTTAGAHVIHTQGAGSAFGPGATWNCEFEFTFEGLPNVAPGTNLLLSQIGFSTSASTRSSPINIGIQKTANAILNYAFCIYTAGTGNFATKNVSYAKIGDDPENDDDLTDLLKIAVTLTKTSTADTFDLLTTLTNVDTGEVVSTIHKTITNSSAYASNLYGYFSTGGVQEANNWDLLDIHSYKYAASPAISDYSTGTGTIALNEFVDLDAAITPNNATMRNVVWQSSNPSVATVDKFGRATGLAPGATTISLYTWDDARPVATGQSAALDTSGLEKQVTLVVHPSFVNMDEDNDGIEDSWENAYFENQSTASASTDQDLDGYSDYSEFRAGTNPADPNSYFWLRLSTSMTATVQSDLSWPAATGRTYSVMYTNDLNSDWNLLENITATPPENTYSVNTEESSEFYKVIVD